MSRGTPFFYSNTTTKVFYLVECRCSESRTGKIIHQKFTRHYVLSIEYLVPVRSKTLSKVLSTALSRFTVAKMEGLGLPMAFGKKELPSKPESSIASSSTIQRGGPAGRGDRGVVGGGKKIRGRGRGSGANSFVVASREDGGLNEGVKVCSLLNIRLLTPPAVIPSNNKSTSVSPISSSSTTRRVRSTKRRICTKGKRRTSRRKRRTRRRRGSWVRRKRVLQREFLRRSMERFVEGGEDYWSGEDDMISSVAETISPISR